MSLFKDILKKLLTMYEEEDFETKISTDLSLMVHSYIDKNFLSIDLAIKNWISKNIKSDILNDIDIVKVFITMDKTPKYKIICLVKKDEETISRVESSFKPICFDKLLDKIQNELTINGECILFFK